jgi:DNA-binding FadR family transcriptional regulator
MAHPDPGCQRLDHPTPDCQWGDATTGQRNNRGLVTLTIQLDRKTGITRRRQPLYQAAQEEIKAYIIRHSLGPGDPLPPETELAQQLGIGRNSVREAVRSLEAVGILETRQGSGLFVRGFSFSSILSNLPYGMVFQVKELTNILEVRSYLEHATVERVLKSATPEQLTRLHDLLERMRQEAERGAYSADDDRLFHQILYESVDNRLLVEIMDIFWVVLQQVQQHNPLPAPFDPMDTYRRHARIVEALENHDVQAMRAAFHRQYIGIEARLHAFHKHRSSIVESCTTPHE